MASANEESSPAVTSSDVRSAAEIYTISCDLYDRCVELNGQFSALFSSHSSNRLSSLRDTLFELTNRLTYLRNQFFEVTNSLNTVTGISENVPPPGLTSGQINTLPQARYGKVKSDLQCGICLARVKRNTLLRHLPCGHQYHPRCINKWLRQTATCPNCRSVVAI